MRLDVELFALAGAIAETISLANDLSPLRIAAEVGGCDSQRGPRHGEVRVQFHRFLQVRNRRVVLHFLMLIVAQTEGLQRLQRRCGGFVQWLGELLHRGQGLAHFLAEVGGGLIQRLEHLLLAVNLHLFACQCVPGRAIQGGQRDDVVIAEAGNGASQHGFDALALADFAGNFVGEALIPGPAHEAQSLADFDSGTMFRYGDCSNCTARACFRVPSKTASPVVFTKSASRTLSFSPSFADWRERQYRLPAMRMARNTSAAGTRIFKDFFAGVIPLCAVGVCATLTAPEDAAATFAEL